MKFLPIVFLLAVAAGEALGEICHPPKTPTKLIARRTWRSRTATTTTGQCSSTYMTTTSAKPTTVTTTFSPSTTTPTTTTLAAKTTPSPILFNCSVSYPACGTMCTNLTPTGGVVQSPNFPADYGNENRECVATITVPKGWMIQLKFTTFNVEMGHVTVFDSASKKILSPTSGNTIPGVIPTTIDFMSIYFQYYRDKPSNATNNWRATFSVTSQENYCSVLDPACGNMCTNVTSAGSGIVQSPNYPGDYGNYYYRYCQVAIVVTAGKRIQLTVTKLNLETGYCYIYVGDSSTTPYLLGVTGSAIPPVVTTIANYMYIEYIITPTKTNTTIYNWQATYTAVAV